MSDAGARRPKSGLGRGLNALLGDVAQDEREAKDAPTRGAVRLIPVSAIAPHPDQPRRHFDEAALDELAASISERGLIQPIIVRPHGHDYQIVAGERRWRAAQRARLHEVPVVVRDYSDSETLQIALLENIQRQDLNAIEEARAYQRLIDEFGHTQDALARAVHKSRSHVANLLRLLDLPEDVQSRVVEGTLTMGHARAMIGADDPGALADQVVAQGLSVRQTEKLASQGKRGTRDSGETRSEPRRVAPASTGSADIEALERQLADLLGLRVHISFNDDGRGSITLDYSSLEQLDMVCQRLSGERI
ncbi:ParB/RepB/Spo0J family partition protein [Sphingomonas sp. BK235]|jgi:ParB family transcriptional regulator, chromosome partitioning protein|uniref:ParB/RepB/Spo0J family partition protein n=1 Tax=Sphingomonas sp. BK235 TaxID=2512131 RepID=UPI00104CAA89|nr:ParB/RepB/Spo0J family partition protein [Sphingomonas sp. BK235]TCP35667.1 ParB family chromosome partitioning protein [Sphingomonas sp. BK235]